MLKNPHPTPLSPKSSTGGIRCERASALLKYKMENDPEIKDLGIQGVYQLQGGIDKYFKEFPGKSMQKYTSCWENLLYFDEICVNNYTKIQQGLELTEISSFTLTFCRWWVLGREELCF